MLHERCPERYNMFGDPIEPKKKGVFERVFGK